MDRAAPPPPTAHEGVLRLQAATFVVVLALGAALARLSPAARSQLAPGAPGLRALAYGVGALAAFWVVERVAGFVA